MIEPTNINDEKDDMISGYLRASDKKKYLLEWIRIDKPTKYAPSDYYPLNCSYKHLGSLASKTMVNLQKLK